MAKPRKTYNTSKKKKTGTKKSKSTSSKKSEPINTDTPSPEENTPTQEEFSAPPEEITPEEQQNLEEHRAFRDGIASDLIPKKEPLPEGEEMDALQVGRIERDDFTPPPTDNNPIPPNNSDPIEPQKGDDFTPPPDTITPPPVPPADIPIQPDIPTQPDTPIDGPTPPAPVPPGLVIPEGSAEDTFEFCFTGVNYVLENYVGGLVKIKILKEYKKFPSMPPVIEEHNETQVNKILLDKKDKELLRQPSIDMIKKMGEGINTPENRFIAALVLVGAKKLKVIPEIRRENQKLVKKIKLLLAEHAHSQSKFEAPPEKHTPPPQEKKKQENYPKNKNDGKK